MVQLNGIRRSSWKVFPLDCGFRQACLLRPVVAVSSARQSNILVSVKQTLCEAPNTLRSFAWSIFLRILGRQRNSQHQKLWCQVGTMDKVGTCKHPIRKADWRQRKRWDRLQSVMGEAADA